jgi:hypothetical protein
MRGRDGGGVRERSIFALQKAPAVGTDAMDMGGRRLTHGLAPLMQLRGRLRSLRIAVGRDGAPAVL